ncbi:M48 family metalloprotease [Comamonas piscis]
MTFWDFQASARRRTWGLLAAFALLVLGIVAGVHLVLALVFWIPALVAVAFSSLRLEQVSVHYPAGFLATNVGIVTLMVLGGAWIKRSNLSQGGQHLAQQLGARAALPSVSHAEQQYLNIVDELCIAAGAQRPLAMVLPRDLSLNAFAAAWQAEDAVIVVSMGALNYLSRDELKGVVAHELSHLHEGDTRLNMELAGYVFGLEMLFNYGSDWVERGVSLFGRPLMAVGWLGWLAAQALKAAVSRQREYLADARALQWTRNPDGLGRVLRKALWLQDYPLQADALQTRAAAAGAYSPLVEHMLLLEVHSVEEMHDFWHLGGARWLASHPTLEERIARVYGEEEAREALPLQDAEQRWVNPFSAPLPLGEPQVSPLR